MHAVAGIHSAMAIKRQRHRREVAARERERRLSTHSSESGDTHHSLHGSTRRKYRHHASGPTGSGMLDTKVVTSIGMLHIGVVFLVFGIFLLGAGLLPNDMSGVNVGKALFHSSYVHDTYSQCGCVRTKRGGGGGMNYFILCGKCPKF